MKKRFKRYLLYLFVQYIPGTTKLAKSEAKLMAKYVFDNFSEGDRLIILSEMKHHLIELIDNQVKEEESELKQKSDELKLLKQTLTKLQTK